MTPLLRLVLLAALASGCSTPDQQRGAAKGPADLFAAIEVGMVRRDVEELLGAPRGRHSGMLWYLRSVQAGEQGPSIGIVYEEGRVTQKYLFTPGAR